MEARARRLLPWLAVLALLASSGARGETVAGSLRGGRDHGWNYRYDIALADGAVEASVRIHLVGAGGVTPAQLGRVKGVWKEGAERMWNDKFALLASDGALHPLRVRVEFDRPPYHHEVAVRPGAGPDDMLNWHLTDSPALVAHEVGHALGVYDEYRGGGVAPLGTIIDPEGVMSVSPGAGSAMRERYYHFFLDWFRARTGFGARLVAVGDGGLKL